MALIVPFNVLYSLIITGAMLDRGSIEEVAFIVLAGIYLLLLIIVATTNATVYVSKECRNKGNENYLKCVENKKFCNYVKQILSFFVDVFAVITVIVYYVGDNINEATPGEDLTVQSIIILLGAVLGFRIISSVKKYFKNLFKSEEPKDDSLEQFIEKIHYATLRTLSLVPEVDATYTIFINLVNLMSDNCRMRKYNVLWVIYGGILLILIIEMAYAFISAFRIHKEYLKKLCWIAYSIIVVLLGVVGTGLFFVADNEQPLDCSPDYHRITTPTEKPVNITLHETENNGLRIGFLVISLLCSCTIIVIAGVCWIYSLYQDYNEEIHVQPLEMQPRQQNETTL